MRPKLLQLVQVEWIDAASTDIGWTNFDDLTATTEPMLSVGWIIRYDDKVISLVQNMYKEEQDRHYSHLINIPVSSVVEIQILEQSVKVTHAIHTTSLSA